MIITLEAWEYEHAYQVGIRRFTENWTKKDAAYYDKSKMEEDRNAQPAAAICELAVAKYTNQYWSGHVWNKQDHAIHKGKPDVGTNIEVRRVRTQSGPAVRDKDLNRNLIIWGARLVDSEYKTVELLGWIEADKGFEVGEYRKGYKIIPADKLNKDWL